MSWDQFKPGAFQWCVERVDVGDPVVSQIVRRVCRQRSVWPEQMLGRNLARGAVSPRSYPLATGPCEKPSSKSYIVLARRMVWRATYELTDWSIDEIAAAIGGYSPASVAPWARSWDPFWKQDPEWWSHWGPAIIDDVGCDMPEEFIGRLRDSRDPVKARPRRAVAA